MTYTDDDHAQRVARALVDEIWTEMGRKRITSVRALALASGMLPQQMAARLKVDPKTKRPVIINIRDLAAIAGALDLPASELMARAEAAVDHEGQATVASLPKRSAGLPDRLHDIPEGIVEYNVITPDDPADQASDSRDHGAPGDAHRRRDGHR